MTYASVSVIGDGTFGIYFIGTGASDVLGSQRFPSYQEAKTWADSYNSPIAPPTAQPEPPPDDKSKGMLILIVVAVVFAFLFS